MNPSEPDEAAHKIPASEAGLMLSIEAADLFIRLVLVFVE